MAQLGSDNEKGCVDACLVFLIPHGSDEVALKERRRRMAAANEVLKGLKGSARKQSIPSAVWASTAQVDVAAAFNHCGGGAEVSMALWKVKRNRAAVLTQALTVSAGSQFVTDVLAGNGNFCALPVSADVLLGKHAGEHGGKAREGLLPPGFLDWSHPSNVMQEQENALPPAAPQTPDTQHLETVTPPSDDALLL